MTNIVLARLSASYDRRADLRVHSFDAFQDNDDGMRKAFCGFGAHHSVLESVPAFTGLCCELCLAHTPIEAANAPARDEIRPPADDPTSTALYAVGLRGEFIWHHVPERPLVQRYENREVVITECGRIAFLVFGTPSERYQRCTDCPVHAEVVP